jgi:ABC-type sugar transport system, periplasmic component
MYFFNKVNAVYDQDDNYVFSDDPKYHLSLILSSEDDIYWQQFKEGAFEAREVYNAAIEFNPISEWSNSGEAVEYINIACESRVDGIIVAAENNENLSEAIIRATQKGINIVVGVVESVNSSRLAYVGTNFYEYGVQAGKLIEKAAGDDSEVKLAVILSSDNSEESDTAATTQNDVMLNGLKSVIGDDDRINLVSTMYRSSDLLGAADLTKDILAQYPDIDIIFCTNAKDTVAAARVLIDRSLARNVKIVGTDVTDEIKYFIDRQIVFGVLDRNGYEAGFNSVRVMCESIGGTFQSSYGDINVDVYTEVNIANYE